VTSSRCLAYSDGVFFGPFDCFVGFGGCNVGSFAAVTVLLGAVPLVELPNRNFTYDPGASSSTLSLPLPGTRGHLVAAEPTNPRIPLIPPRPRDAALANHSSAVPGMASLVQWQYLFATGGFTTPAMWSLPAEI
jgi:hypothetical protein